MVKGLYAFIITYNDYPLIKKAVESLEDQVEKIIAVDGKYNEFPSDHLYSNDGTQEYLSGHPKVELHYLADVSEVEKRTYALKLCKEAKWFMFIDADEELVGQIKEPEADTVQIPHCPANRPGSIVHRNRIFRNIEGLYFEHIHYWLKDKDGDTFSLLVKTGHKYTQERQEQLLIKHYDEERPKERKAMKNRYYRVLRPREVDIKEVL